MEKSSFSRRYTLLRQLVRTKRQSAGLTQTELAELLDEPQSYISKVENGERRLDLVQLHAFCDALGVPLRDIVDEYVRQTSRKTRS